MLVNKIKYVKRGDQESISKREAIGGERSEGLRGVQTLDLVPSKGFPFRPIEGWRNFKLVEFFHF